MLMMGALALACGATAVVEFTSTKVLSEADRERLRALGYGEFQLDGLAGEGDSPAGGGD
ncbi:MAG: hypothetical protein AAFZ65_16855 [Planctomycetota bacterium]